LFFLGIVILFSSKLIPPNIGDYLKTKKGRWYLGIFTAGIIAIILVHFIPDNLYPLVFLRYIFGALLIIWLPGYSFIRAIFGLKIRFEIPKSIDTFQSIGLVLCSNLAIVPFTGLILNFTPWGIGLTSIIFGLFIFTMFFGSIALIRECQVQ
jgi:uncharacterized membrane protein